jgi:hypothetical protein
VKSVPFLDRVSDLDLPDQYTGLINEFVRTSYQKSHNPYRQHLKYITHRELLDYLDLSKDDLAIIERFDINLVDMWNDYLDQ